MESKRIRLDTSQINNNDTLLFNMPILGLHFVKHLKKNVQIKNNVTHMFCYAILNALLLSFFIKYV